MPYPVSVNYMYRYIWQIKVAFTVVVCLLSNLILMVFWTGKCWMPWSMPHRDRFPAALEGLLFCAVGHVFSATPNLAMLSSSLLQSLQYLIRLRNLKGLSGDSLLCCFVLQELGEVSMCVEQASADLCWHRIHSRYFYLQPADIKQYSSLEGRY